MNYSEMIAKALKGRSVNSMAKLWGVSQKALDRYVKEERIPEYDLAEKIIQEAGISKEEAFDVLAAATREHKERLKDNSGGPPVSRTRHQRIMSPLL